tara:strand:+ start:242 stop:415 length:174 start_codon:yes stop_codon:yes gene_type:complete
MITLRVMEEELPVLMEALHFFGAELQHRIKTYDEDDQPKCSQKMRLIDQVIAVIKKT